MKYLGIQVQDFLTHKGQKKMTPLAFYASDKPGAEFFHEGLPNSHSSPNTFDWFQIPPMPLPFLDHFVLKALYGHYKRNFDWIRLDVYGMAGGFTFLAPTGWLVSERFREIVSRYSLSDHKFYPAKLLFKGELLDYYFLQWGKQVNVIFSECTYVLRNQRQYKTRYTDPDPVFEFWESERITASELGIKSREDYISKKLEFRNQIKDLIIKDYVYEQQYDFINPLFGPAKLIIEPLAKELTAQGISGTAVSEVEDRGIAFLKG